MNNIDLAKILNKATKVKNSMYKYNIKIDTQIWRDNKISNDNLIGEVDIILYSFQKINQNQLDNCIKKYIKNYGLGSYKREYFIDKFTELFPMFFNLSIDDKITTNNPIVHNIYID